jgi:hypothetical protein
MLIHTTSVGETTNNLVSQDFTTGWTGTNVDTRHGNGTIAGVDGEYVVSDDISLSTDVGLNKNEVNDGFTIDASSNIWFWNSYSQSVTQTITTTDDNGNVITQNRVIQGVQNGYQNYSDQLIIGDNTQEDYTLSLRYDFSVPGTTGHYGADLKEPSLTVTYTPKQLDSAIENQIVQLFDDFKPEEDLKIVEDNFTFEEPGIMDQGPEVKMEEMEMVEFFDEPVMMEEMKEEESFDEPMMTMAPMMEDDKKEDEPVMEMVMEFFDDEKKEEKEISEEESNSDPTESTNAEESDNQEQKETVRSEKTKTVRLETVLEKIESEVKALDKNLQLTSLVKLSVMAGENPLDAYNIPFYEPRIIYEDQLNIQDNRVIYTQDLVEYKQNDPIFIQKQQLNRVLQERQNLINELEVLRNG